MVGGQLGRSAGASAQLSVTNGGNCRFCFFVICPGTTQQGVWAIAGAQPTMVHQLRVSWGAVHLLARRTGLKYHFGGATPPGQASVPLISPICLVRKNKWSKFRTPHSSSEHLIGTNNPHRQRLWPSSGAHPQKRQQTHAVIVPSVRGLPLPDTAFRFVP